MRELRAAQQPHELQQAQDAHHLDAPQVLQPVRIREQANGVERDQGDEILTAAQVIE